MDTWGNLSNLWIPCVYHLDQGIPVEYELDTFNTPPQEQLYVPPKLAMSVRCLILLSFHLWTTLMETTHTSPPNPPDAQNSRWLQSLFPPTANMAFAKLRRNTIPRTTHDTRCFLNSIISPFRLLLTTFPTRLAAQTQTKYSMLQIKTIPKNTFRLRTSWNFSPLLTITNLVRKQLNVNTHTCVTPSSSLKTKLSLVKNNNKTPG